VTTAPEQVWSLRHTFITAEQFECWLVAIAGDWFAKD
jgi:hypothetical protein